MKIVKIPLFILSLCCFLASSYAENPSEEKVLYQKQSAEDLALTIEQESRFNELNLKLRMVYERGVGVHKNRRN